MGNKIITGKFRYRIEPKPGGGFIARAEEGSTETLEGSTQEEVQKKLDDKLTALVGEMLHNDKLTDMVGEMLHDRAAVGRTELRLGGAQVRVNVTSNSAKYPLSQQTLPPAGNLGVAPSPGPRFEASNKLWLIIALAMALGGALMYLVKQ